MVTRYRTPPKGGAKRTKISTHRVEFSLPQPLDAELFPLALSQTKIRNRCRQYDFKMELKVEKLYWSLRMTLYLLVM